MTIRFIAIPSEVVGAYRSGGADAYDLSPERAVSSGAGNPCRHCLDNVPEGADMLILAHRPFPALQPYAETGPIFLCAEDCAAWAGDGIPPMLASADYIIRGYSADDRIVYGTGRVALTTEIETEAEKLFADPKVAYIHVRSARNNCYQCRIDRA